MEETTQTVQKKGGVNPILIAVIVIVVIAGLGYMFVNSNNPASTDPESMTANPTGAAATTGTESETTGDAMTAVRTIQVEAGSFYYKPNVIRVKKGEKVKIEMKAVSMMHDFNIDELDVKMPIVQNGDTGTVEFTATEAGSFEYYCSVGQHRAQGQVGTLIVE